LGLPTVRDSDQLIGGNVAVKVAIKVEGEDKKNEVKGFKAITGSAPPAPSASSPAPVKAAAPPWAKK
jgi:hypothetical protein